MKPGLKPPGFQRLDLNEEKTCFQLETWFLSLRHYGMGQALLALGDKGDVGDVKKLREAQAALERALELEPDNKTAKKLWKEVGISLQLHDSDSD